MKKPGEEDIAVYFYQCVYQKEWLRCQVPSQEGLYDSNEDFKKKENKIKKKKRKKKKRENKILASCNLYQIIIVSKWLKNWNSKELAIAQ